MVSARYIMMQTTVWWNVPMRLHKASQNSAFHDMLTLPWHDVNNPTVRWSVPIHFIQKQWVHILWLLRTISYFTHIILSLIFINVMAYKLFTYYDHILVHIYMFTWSHVLFDIVLIVLKNVFCLIRSLFMSIIYLLVYFTWNKMITKSFTFLIHDISYSHVKKCHTNVSFTCHIV